MAAPEKNCGTKRPREKAAPSGRAMKARTDKESAEVVAEMPPGCKECNKCGERLPLDQFALDSLSRQCNACIEKQVEEARRTKYPDGLKKCSKCKASKPFSCYRKWKETLCRLMS